MSNRGENMSENNVRVIDVNVGIFEENDRIAADVRAQNKANGTFMVNVMASPGAGKTTTLLRTIEELGGEYNIGVMEADIEATVDADPYRRRVLHGRCYDTGCDQRVRHEGPRRSVP